MPSTITGSEQALATVGCRHLTAPGGEAPGEAGRRHDAPRVIIGGLGMGFTVRAALDILPPDATVVVAELLPDVVQWNERFLGHLAGHPLRDGRVQVQVDDVLRVIRGESASVDAILLDVDNGPAEFAATGNEALYGRAGLQAIRRALRPGGVLAVWSAWEDRRFARRLGSAGFVTTLERVRGHGSRGARHLIYRARPTASVPAPSHG